MYPYFLNGQPNTLPVGDPMGINLGMFPRLDPDLREYPEEVREALEAHQDRIHSAADLRDVAEEQMRRR